MGVEKFNLVFQGDINGDLVDDVLLGTVDNSDVSELQVDFLVEQHFFGAGSLVHDVDFADDSNGSFAGLVPLSSQFEAVGSGEILVGRNDT